MTANDYGPWALNSPVFQYSDNDLSAIEEAGGRLLAPDHRCRLQDSIAYIIRTYRWNQAFGPNDKNPTRVQIAKAATTLVECFDRLDRQGDGIMALALLLDMEDSSVTVTDPGSGLADLHLDEVRDSLQKLRALARRATVALPDPSATRRNGRPRDTHLEALCRSAAEIFARAGGVVSSNGEITTEFACFLRALNAPLPQPYKAASPAALYGHFSKVQKWQQAQRDWLAARRRKKAPSI